MGFFGDLFQAVVRLFSGGGAPPARSEAPAKPTPQQRPPVQQPQEQRHHRRKTPDDLNVPSKKPFDKQSLPQTRREGDRLPGQNQINQNNEHYVVLRAEATREGDLMAQCYRQSHEAYQQGQGALAKELSEKGGVHKRRMERLNAEAGAWIFRENNLDSKPGEVDLHGLYVKEAVMYAEGAIDKAQRRGDSEIRLIVGKGLHSNGQVAKIKPALEELMKRRGLPAETDPDNAGLLVICLRVFISKVVPVCQCTLPCSWLVGLTATRRRIPHSKLDSESGDMHAFVRSSSTCRCRLFQTLPRRAGLSRSYVQDHCNPLPFPSQRNPKPHDIFHLPKSATQREIKQRYYELVRIYHPDSIITRRDPPEVSQERIQAINEAYGILSGRNVSQDEPETIAVERRMDPTWLRSRISRRPYFDDVSADDRWKERFIVMFAAFALIGFVAQTSYYRLQVIQVSPPWTAKPRTKNNTQYNDGILAESDSLDDGSRP